MNNTLKKALTFPLKLSLTIVSILLVVTAILMISLQGFVIWLNTQKGSNWVEAQIQNVITESPYSVEISKFYLSGPASIGTKSLTILENEQAIINAKDLKLAVNIFPLAIKTVSLALKADSISLLNLPTSNDKPSKGVAFPLSIPDSYFNKLNIYADIDKFSVSETIAGNPLETHIKLTQSIALSDDNVTVNGQITLKNTTHKSAEFIPEQIVYKGKLNTKDGQFELSELNIENAIYDISSIGNYNIAENSFSGEINALSFYKDYKTSLKIPVIFKDNNLALDNMTGIAMDTPVSASLHISDNTLTAHASVLGINYQGAEIEDVTANIKIQDLSNMQTLDAKLITTNITYDTSIIKAIKVAITPKDKGLNIVLNGNGIDTSPFSISSDIDIPDLKDLTAKINKLEIMLDQGKLNISGAITPQKLDLTLSASDIDLTKIPVISLPETPLTLKDGDIALTGTFSAPRLTSNLNWAVTFEDNESAMLTTSISYDGDALTADLSVSTKGVTPLNGNVSIPMTLSFTPFIFDISKQTILNGKLKGNVNISDFSKGLISTTGINIKGKLSANATLSGTLGEPLLDGLFTLNKGYIYDPSSNLELQNISAKASFDNNVITLKSLTAKDNDNGTLNGSGSLSYNDPKNPNIDFNLKLKSMSLLQGENVNAEMDADLTLRSHKGGYLLSGNISPEEIVITLPDRFNKGIPKLNIVKKNATKQNSVAKKINLDITFDAEKRIFVRGWGLDTELGGKLAITGTASEPYIRGNLSSLRGVYEEFGKKFELERAILRFQGKVPPSPYLDVLAVTQADDINVHIAITGQATQPDLSLSAIPSLPEDEIFSRILFGTNTQKISPYQAIKLAQSMRRFSGKSTGPSIDPLGTIRSVTGLDDITVEGIGTENATVGAGKYISDTVYVELEQGSAEGSGAASVAVEITPNISVESKAGQNGSAGAGIFWEWDY